MLFRTPRLNVRHWTQRDLPAAFRIYSDPAVVEWLNTAPTQSLEQQSALLQAIIDKSESDPTYGFRAIERLDDGVVIGSVLLKPLPNDPRVEIGWHLARAEWGQGYATEAARGALHHGFEIQNLESIYAITLPTNLKSQAVMHRLGMRHVGSTDEFHNLTLEFFRLDRSDWVKSIDPND